MLLSEMVRKISDEEILVNDTTSYAGSGVCDWVTLATKQVTLSSQRIVFVRFTGYAHNCTGNARVLLGSVPLLSTGALTISQTRTVETFVVLTAGTYTFTFQISNISVGTGGTMKITLIYIASLNFSDVASLYADSGNIQVGNNATVTVLDQNVTMASARRTPAGTTKEVWCFIKALMFAVDLRKSTVINNGATSGLVNWRLKIDNAQKTWTEKYDDYLSSLAGTNDAYAEGAYGCFLVKLNVGQTVNIKIEAYNYNTGASQTCRAVITVIACPWFMGNAEHQPISLSFPQGSTLYLVTEPFTGDPAKTVKIGKKRFVSYGDTTDYYYTASGTGILTAAYTFEAVTVESCVLLVGGSGGCISVIAVDVR